jgi:hypothetical protein
LAGFCEHLATLELWPEPPEWEGALRFRNWAFESAALDLALRQAGRSLHDVLGLEPRLVRFVMYGGGMGELGVGRGQIELLAALFHADAPNDVAPSAYNDDDPPGTLPPSPLPPRPDATDFRRAT